MTRPAVAVAALALITVPATLPRDARELAPQEQAQHVLHRLAFGPRPGDVERVLALGVDRWIADQLRPERGDDPGVSALRGAYPLLTRTASELQREFPPPGALRRAAANSMTRDDSTALREQLRSGRAFVAQLLSARIARAVAAERQLDEVMVDFWLNHFNVFIGKNARLRYHLPTWEREVIRPHALGKFRDLLGAVATSPAMLIYLDNAVSVADSSRPTLVDRRTTERRIALARRRVNRGRVARIDSATFEQVLARRPRGLNENYARELLELHTLGVDGGYTQQDVINVARALTGWTVRPGDDDGFTFNRATHDAGEKVILGQRFPGGKGQEEGERVLDLLAKHPATARFIAQKLVVRFVSDEPPAALVDRAAETFARTDGDLREVVRTIVTSDEFFSRAAWRAKVKSPFEVVVSAARALGGRPDTTALTAAIVAQLGQPLYGHQAPDGWPETGTEWMNTGAILGRINFGLQVGANRLPGVRLTTWPAWGELADEPRARQVDGVIAALLGGSVSAETREVLMTGRNPLMEGAGEEADAATGVDLSMTGVERRRSGEARDPRPVNRRAVAGGRSLPPLSGLAQLVALAVGAPEFQRR